MSLLGDLAGSLLSGGQQQQGGGLAGIALQMLMNQGGGQGGGLAGLVGAMQSKGLGDIVGSWVGTGPNKAIQPDQLASVLGQDQLAQLAKQSGLSEQATSSQLADLLPGLIDKLTPGGQMPQQSDLMSTGMGLLKGFMGGR